MPLLLAALALGSFAALEVAVRLLSGTPRTERLPLLRVAPDRGLGYRPLAHDEHFAYEQRVVLNSLGMRGPEPRPRVAQEYRILALGETQLYGLGLADGELLSARLAALLGARSPRPVTVLNFGVRAYGARQQAALLAHSGVALRPDRVLLVWYPHSFNPTEPARAWRRVRDRDWYMLDLDARPQGWPLWRWRMRQWLRRSAALSWLHYRFKRLGERDRVAGRLLRGVRDAQVERALAGAAAALKEIAALGRRHGFDVTLVSLPPVARLEGRWPRSLYTEVLANLAREHGMDFVDLGPALRELRRRSGRLPVAPFDDHYDGAAHAAVAARLAEALQVPGAD